MKTINTYDIAVCGGGFAGISAALAAAREGKKVVLFEKQYMLGGLGTAGLVTIYLPLCDGMGRQVSFGIAEELFKLSIKYGAEALYPGNWLDGTGPRTEKDARYEVRYNAQVFAILAEQLLLENGVDILYGSYVVGVKKQGQKIESLFIENKSGKTEYSIKTVVDATGDCDIAIATTGLAGPNSDESGLPVGLSFIAIGTLEKVCVYQYTFDGTREEITEKAISYALYLACKQLKDL